MTTTRATIKIKNKRAQVSGDELLHYKGDHQKPFFHACRPPFCPLPLPGSRHVTCCQLQANISQCCTLTSQIIVDMDF